ncbi:MAG: hypothetical protein KAI18_03310 [Candidatus Aenigmarchaeota archaeon]|nr:hypothetical protein [Candidatus Aenigmarchaeota archaeon]
MDLYDLIGNLKDVGFYDILLPWALFFAMTYGLLTSVGPFSTKKEDGKEPTDQGIPAIISMAVAFFIIAYTPFGLSFGSYLAILFGKSGTVLVGLLVIVLFLGMAGIKMEDKPLEDNKTKIALALIVIVAIIYLGTGNLLSWINISGITEETISTLLMLAVIIGGVFWVTKK